MTIQNSDLKEWEALAAKHQQEHDALRARHDLERRRHYETPEHNSNPAPEVPEKK
jgi:hypothetical protein